MTKRKPTAKDVFKMLHSYNALIIGDAGVNDAYLKMAKESGCTVFEPTPEQKRVSIAYQSAIKLLNASTAIISLAQKEIKEVKG